MPRLSFEIEAEDRGSAEVNKLGRNVDALDKDIDGLSRSLRDEARAADQSESSTRRLGLAMGGATAAVGGLAAGFIALTRQQAEYHRLVERSAFVSNRSQQDVEALIRTFEQYGIQIDSTEDALRTFYDRLGDARADPNIEAAQIFRQVGLEIDSADVRLEDFLERLQSFDRQSQIFIVETVLGGEGSAILQAAADAGFRGNLEANLQMTLDPDDREAILQADQQIERATQQLSISIDRLLASDLGASLIDRSIAAAERVVTNLTDIVEGRFFSFVGEDGPDALSRAGRGIPETQGPPIPEGFVPPTATSGRRLVIEEAPATAEAVADEIVRSPSFAQLAGTIQARNNRGVVGGLRGQAGPGLAFAGEQVPVPAIGGVDVGAGAELQVAFASMTDDLSAIHFELAEFLPEIANNTLNALGAAAQFAVQPNVVSLVQAGVATARAVGELLDLGQPRPVGSTEVQDFAFLGPGGDADAATTGDINIDVELAERLREIIGDDLTEAHAQLQTEAQFVWQTIQGYTSDTALQIQLFNEYISGEFTDAWDDFANASRSAWATAYFEGEISREQLALYAEYLSGGFADAWDDFERRIVDAWTAAKESGEVTAEELEALDAFFNNKLIGQTLPLLEQVAVNTWAGIHSAEIDEIDRLKLIDEFISTNLPGSLTSLKEVGTEVWSGLSADIEEGEEGAVKLAATIDDISGVTLPDLSVASNEAIADIIEDLVNGNLAVGDHEGKWNDLPDAIQGAGKAVADTVVVMGVALDVGGQLVEEHEEEWGSLEEQIAASKRGVDAFEAALDGLTDKTVTITTVHRDVFEGGSPPPAPAPAPEIIPLTFVLPERPEDEANEREFEQLAETGIYDETPTRFSEGENQRNYNELAETGIYDETPERFQLMEDRRRDLLSTGFQDGGRFLVDRPAGEAGRELVQITPENAQAPEGGREPVQVQINISAVDAPSVEELVRGSGRDAIVEVIRDATSNGEAVVSTRGLVNDEVF